MVTNDCGCTFTPQGECINTCEVHKDLNKNLELQEQIESAQTILDKSKEMFYRVLTWAFVISMIALFFWLSKGVWW